MMSNFSMKAICKKTGREETIHCIDNYFGKSEYGYNAHGSYHVMREDEFRILFKLEGK